MDKLLEQLITEAAHGLEQAEGFGTAEQMDFTGFRGRVERMDDLLIAALFPQHAGHLKSLDIPARLAREQYLHEAMGHLKRCLEAVLADNGAEQDRVVRSLLSALPEIRRQLGTDLIAAYQGDPAAKSADEVILCYPAFTAIATYRLAHVLYREKVPLIPRVMTEYAHRLTGIDIHPGAAIGDYFFIDHGTGVVIGETTTIGEHVKLYQHVTLGAKSFAVEEDGTLVKGIKRHPDIGDNVVIYAGATVLGGNTRIGNGCVIGGSVWLTHSVEPMKLVLARAAVSGDILLRDNLPELREDSDEQRSLLAAML
jgi:serine O-acetyltransferase